MTARMVLASTTSLDRRLESYLGALLDPCKHLGPAERGSMFCHRHSSSLRLRFSDPETWKAMFGEFHQRRWAL
jgi:hypothetical protein